MLHCHCGCLSASETFSKQPASMEHGQRCEGCEGSHLVQQGDDGKAKPEDAANATRMMPRLGSEMAIPESSSRSFTDICGGSLMSLGCP